MSDNAKRSLSTQLAERSISASEWHTLSQSLFPGAKTESVLLAIDYCRARKLDPLKKPCHIVPMKVNREWRDVILPGIYELRTTAQRTGEYLGHTKPEYGPPVEYLGVTAPEHCSMVFRRWNPASETIAEFPVTVEFTECCGTTWKDGKEIVNARWSKAPKQMLTKCAEAAGLREAFPDEIGGEMAAEEMDGAGDYAPPPRARESVTLDEMASRKPAPEKQEDPEPYVMEGEVVDNDDTRGLTFDEVKAMVDSAETPQQLDEALDAIRSLNNGEAQTLKRKALDKYRVMMTPESA